MPNAKFEDWTPLPVVAELLLNWSKGKDRPQSGSLIKISTKKGETKFETVNKNT